MSSVVFTGKGLTRGGVHLTRDEWTDLAHERGHIVLDKVQRGLDYLVASRDNTTKARDARNYGVEVITYEHWQDIMEGGRSTRPAPVQPVAAPTPRFVTREQIAAAGDVRAAIIGNGGTYAGDVHPPAFDRKPIYWRDVDSTVNWSQINALGNDIPVFPASHLAAAGSVYDPCDDIDPDMAAEFKQFGITTFIVNTGTRNYLVNTEGYDYCRYVCQIIGMGVPATRQAAPAPAPVEPERKRRAIRL